MLGRSVLAALGVLAAVLVVAVAVCEWLGWPFLRGPIEDVIEKQVGRDVSFGDDFRLSLIGGLWLASDLFTIGPPSDRPAGSPSDFVRANDVELRLPYSTLIGPLRGSTQPLRVTSLSVAQLSANLWRAESGEANWIFGSGEERGKPVVFPQFDRLVVREGRIRVDDAPSSVHAVIDLSTEEGAQEGAQEGEKGGLKASARGTYAGQPLRAQLRSSGLLPLAQSTAEKPLPITLRVQARGASLEFEGEAADILHLESLRGKFALSGPTLAVVGETIGLTLPDTPAFDLKGNVRRSGQVWEADVASFSVGDSELSGEFTYDPQKEIPLLSGALRGPRLVLADLAPTVGASPARGRNDDGKGKRKNNRRAEADGTAVPKADASAHSGNVLPERGFDIPSLKAMNASVEVDLKRLDLPGDALRSIAPLRAQLTLDDGVLKLERLSATTADGQLRGTLSLDANRQPPLWSADLGWSGVDLAKWITPRNADTKEARPQPYVTGTLSGNAKFAGSGRSTASILGSLDGQVFTWVRDGTLSHLLVEALGLDIAQGVGLLAVGDDPLPLHCAVAQLQAKDGVVETQLVLLDTPDSTVLVDGSVSLAKERLDLTVRARPKDFSPFTVRAPVHITGSFAQPKIVPDAKTLGAKAAAAALLAAINPLAALIPLMDPADPATRRCADVLASGGKGGEKPRARAPARGAAPVRKPASERRQAPERGPMQ
ncbi:MAG: AsmA family protein [Burkholderiaceae bacterium]|nr:AsmA family protein [Burkholderiaceae bacterium]